MKKKLDRAAKNTALSFYYSLPWGLVLRHPLIILFYYH